MNRGYEQPLKKVSGKLLPDQTKRSDVFGLNALIARQLHVFSSQL